MMFPAELPKYFENMAKTDYPSKEAKAALRFAADAVRDAIEAQAKAWEEREQSASHCSELSVLNGITCARELRGRKGDSGPTRRLAPAEPPES